MEEERLDKLLVQLKLVTTRVQAEKIIKKDGVKVNGKLITKTGKRVPVNAVIELLAQDVQWVSRDAIKLVEAIKQWNPKVQNATVLDVGTSVGGFSEVLIANDVQKVYCVKSGTKQLHPSLLNHEKVFTLENTHVRELTNKLLPNPIDGCTVNTLSTSLEYIFPFIHSFLKRDAFLIAVIKPQHEVNKDQLGKGGIVKDKKLFPIVIKKVKRLGLDNHFKYIDHIPSPILGEDGNQEFLMYFKKIDFNYTPPTFKF